MHAARDRGATSPRAVRIASEFRPLDCRETAQKAAARTAGFMGEALCSIHSRFLPVWFFADSVKSGKAALRRELHHQVVNRRQGLDLIERGPSLWRPAASRLGVGPVWLPDSALTVGGIGPTSWCRWVQNRGKARPGICSKSTVAVGDAVVVSGPCQRSRAATGPRGIWSLSDTCTSVKACQAPADRLRPGRRSLRHRTPPGKVRTGRPRRPRDSAPTGSSPAATQHLRQEGAAVLLLKLCVAVNFVL
jgi:hypothetical protein